MNKKIILCIIILFGFTIGGLLFMKVVENPVIETPEITEPEIIYDCDIDEVKSIIAEYFTIHKDELKGEQGISGIRGVQGIQGFKGEKGDRGLTGEKGDTGLQGLQGVQGIQGLIGTTGLKGEKGDTGEMPVGRWETLCINTMGSVYLKSMEPNKCNYIQLDVWAKE